MIRRMATMVALGVLLALQSMGPIDACEGDYCELAIASQKDCVGTTISVTFRGTYRYHRCLVCGRPALAVEVVCC